MLIFERISLLIYLPISLLVYWGLAKNPKAKTVVLLCLSLGFYSLAGWQFLPVLVGLSLATWWLARREWFWQGIVLNLLALGVFKYWDFGVTQLGRLELPNLLPLLNLALPLGLSYYVFKHIGYLVDVQKDRLPATSDWLSFLTFSTLFLQISAGPISSFQDTGEQLKNLPKRITGEQSYKGLLYLTMGLGKKLLLADAILPVFELDFYQAASPSRGLLTLWVYVLLRGIHLYLDFSSYTEIVLGLGYWFGITLPENFNNPYLAKNPRDFWERWHISLSQWFRIYLFAPLSRSLLKRWSKYKDLAQYTANLVTMTLVGLWHGAGWGFVLWGAYHGVLLNINAWLTRKRYRVLETGLYRILTLLAVMFGWVFFYSPGFGSLQTMIASLLGFKGLGAISTFWAQVPEALYLPLGVAFVVTFSGFGDASNLFKRSSRAIAVLAGILLVILLSLSGSPSEFVYVRF